MKEGEKKKEMGKNGRPFFYRVRMRFGRMKARRKKEAKTGCAEVHV